MSARALWILGLFLVAIALVLAIAGAAEPVALVLGFVGGAINLVAAALGTLRRGRGR